MSHLVQHVDHVSERPLHAVPPLIPPPAAEKIRVHGLLVDSHVLREFGWIVVEKVAEGIDGLSDSGGEEGVVLRELLGERDQRLESACLLVASRS